jgi:uncharacterized protein YcsI (UPF0317 family)
MSETGWRAGDFAAIDKVDLKEHQRIREAIRSGVLDGTSRGLARGFVQCNVVILPRALAYDFLVYCQRNAKACPVLEIGEPGDPVPQRLAPSADIRTDVARYRVWRDGERQGDRTDITELWRDDFVLFLIGSGITFDDELQRAGVPTDRYRWVIRTTLPTEPSGPFRGPLVVTMRWLTPAQAVRAVEVTTRFPMIHGAPIHLGDPAAIGADVAAPMFGGPVPPLPQGLVPVFWACGVTPQAAAEQAHPEIMITHAPAHSFITDVTVDRVALS